MKNDIAAIYPLSPMQEGMLYHKLLNETSTEYCVRYILEVNGEIKSNLIETALELLCEKYIILKTAIVYPKKSEKPYQVIIRDRKIEFNVVDLMDGAEALEDLKHSDIERGFDLTKDSLLRVTLIRTCRNKGILLWTFHHIILDGWCSSFVLKDFFWFYTLLLEGNTRDELIDDIYRENKDVATYEDYIRWVTQKDKGGALAYWSEYLKGYENSTVIEPMSEQTNSSEEMRRSSHLLDNKTTEKIVLLSKKLNITVSTVLETALGTLLQKFNRSCDIVFGKVVSGRNIGFKDIDKIVGLFINTIPVRMNVTENMTVYDTLLKMHEESINAMEYEYCPLAEIQNAVIENNDLINILFVYENYYRENINEKIAQYSNKIEFKMLEGREQTNYSINFSVSMQDALKIDILYNPNYFNEQDIEMIMEKYCTILKEILDVEQPLSGIIGISEKERNIINLNSKGIDVSVSNYETLGNALSNVAQRYPQNIALSYNGIGISYEELNYKANIIANELIKYGVKRHSNVMIYAYRDIDTIIAICGIVKIGAVYIPVDPKYPRERIEFIYNDCKASVVLSTDKTNVLFDNSLNISEILLANNEVYEPECVGCKNDLAYIIYTSGTTGQPKGVMVTHENVLRLTRNVNYTQLNCETSLIQTGSLSFDAATFEIWGVLLNGGKVVIAPSDLLLDMVELKYTIEKNRINTMFVTTALFNQIIDIDVTVFDKVKYLLFGGEATSKVHVEKLLQHNKKVALCNVYGPTETTTFATYYPINEVAKSNKIPIGKPIEGTTVYVLNGKTECGIGIPGELYIGGCGVAQGYLNNNDLTKSKFTYYEDINETIYHSGDLVRWLPSGNLEFLGRIDEQIKLRGYRIELSEIENVIRKNVEVKDVAVVTKNIEGELYICAYIVGIKTEDIQDIKTKLKNFLPPYMIPSYIVPIEKFPLNQNGKLDRKALPKISQGISLQTKANESMDDITAKLLDLFSKISGTQSLNLEDNFFENGGHSLKAMKLANKIESIFKIHIPLKMIYKYPTVKELSNYIKSKTHMESDLISKTENAETYFLSSVQEEIYAAALLDDTGIAYNMYLGLVSKNKIDVNRVHEVYKKLLQRHEVLRYGFFEENNCIVQKVFDLDEINSDIEVVYKKIENKECEVEELRNFVQPFNLESPPLFRIKVIITPGSQDIILFNLHHIVADGMSTEILKEEFIQLYFGKNLEDIELCYKDFCVWSKKNEWSVEKNFWKKEIETGAESVDLPFDFVRPAIRSFAGDTLSELIPTSLLDSINDYCHRAHITEYVFFTAVFFALLYQYSRQEELVLGTPFSGRLKKQLQNVVGMFVNTLPINCKITNKMSVYELMTQIKDKCLSIQEYQDFPLGEFVKEYKTSNTSNALFNVLMNYIDFGADSMESDEFAERTISINNSIAKFDMSLTINRSERNCNIQLEYSKDLFLNATVRRMLDHYMLLLNEVVSNDKVLITELPLLLEDEGQTILYEFNSPDDKLECIDTVISLFKESVQHNKERIAIEAKGTKLTYAELDEASNRVASELRRRGIKNNDLIAIVAEHRIETIIGILGIMKAGGAYVPIDISYPEMRNREMLSDCNPLLILQYDNNNCFDIPYLNISNCNKHISKEPYVDNDNIEQSNLAYIIYTSGTTGGAKGVMVTNRNIVRLVKQPNYICMNENTKLLQTGSLCFDAATFEIWGTLTHGGTLYFEDTDILFDLDRLQHYIVDRNINTMWLTVSLFNQIIDEKVDALGWLKYLMIGGEKLSEKHVEKFLRKNKSTILINGYGPTETTTFATYYSLNEWDRKRNIPIGKPINNTQAYVISTGGNLCGVGVPGELCIGGDGVSNGYINNIELTENKFIDNPFGRGKIYKTGDLAKWREDGTLDFLGRIDSQVKMRGFRIELEEIENELKNVPKVLNAVVILSEDRLHLCAYLINEGILDVDFVRQELKRRLPYYMVPTYIQQIDEIPLTVNGKIDKKSLPPIVINGNSEEFNLSENEKLVANICKEILGIGSIGKYDNFYELGGDSITAIKLVSKLKIEGYTISMREIIQKQTICEIAKSIKEVSGTPYLGHQDEKGKVKLSPMQLEFFKWNLPVPEYFNQAIMLRAKGRLDANSVRSALEAIIQCHGILHTTITKDDQTIEVYEKEKFFEFNIFDFFELEDCRSKIEALNTELQKSMKLNGGGMLKVNLYRTLDYDYVLICMHHLVCDIVSWGIFLEDFERGYLQSINGKKIELPIETCSYMNWSERILDCRNNCLSDENRNFWNPKIIEGNRSYMRKSDEYYRTSCRVFNLENLDSVLKKASAYGFSMQEMLLAAFGEAWNKYIGQSEVIINIESHGRDILEEVDVNRTLGWFTCIYPLLIKSNVGNTIADKLSYVKRELLQSKQRLASYTYYKECFSDRVIPNIMFNYSGNEREIMSSELFEKADYSCGKTMDMRNVFSDYIVNCSLKKEKLSINLWVTSGKYCYQEVNLLLEAFQSSIEQMIKYWETVEILMIENSDFESPNNIMIETKNIFNLNHRKLDAKNAENIIHTLLRYDKNASSPINTTCAPFLYQRYFLEQYPDNICCAKVLVKGSLSEKDILKHVHEIVKSQSIFRLSYDRKTGLLETHEYNSSWVIPICEFTDDIAETAFQNSSKMHERLLSKITLAKEDSGWSIYYFVHHCLWDLSSTEILNEITKKIIFNTGDCVVDYYTKYTFERNKSENQIIHSTADIEFSKKYLSEVKSYYEGLDNVKHNCSVEIKYRLTPTLLNSITNNPLGWGMKLYNILNPVRNKKNKIPFVMMQYGRKREEYSTLGLFLDIKPYVFDIESEEIIKDYAQNNIGPMLMQYKLNPYYKDILTILPVINFYIDTEENELFSDYDRYEVNLKKGTGNNEITVRVFQNTLYVVVPSLLLDADKIQEKILQYLKG